MRISFFLKPVLTFALFFLLSGRSLSQTTDTTMYLITCGPGTETYSIYGHSALRVVIGKEDIVFNWGVFDFDTPNFAWKFAKGRLNYMLVPETYESFLRSYFYEQRYVIVQEINLKPDEKRLMLAFIRENLKPENVKYRYDFFYDNCSTRIRDLLEKSLGNKLEYPDDTEQTNPTFRQMIGRYQAPYPWLDAGTDILIGIPGDKKAGVRERMFLPLDMMTGLSNASVIRDGSALPLLKPAEMALDFDPISTKGKVITPFLVFSMLFIVILIISLKAKNRAFLMFVDFTLFFVFSCIALLLIFFNFFSEHDQLRMNLNMIWINPVIILCFMSLVFSRPVRQLFQIVFYTTAGFIILHPFLPQALNVSFYPLMLIILARSSANAGFKWNPLTIR